MRRTRLWIRRVRRFFWAHRMASIIGVLLAVIAAIAATLIGF